MKRNKSILFLAPYPEGQGPSQRFRIEVYFKTLEENKLHYDYQTFYSLKSYKQLYKPGNFINKSIAVCTGFIKRFIMMFQLYQFDYVFVQREITPMGPPIFEWIITKIFRRKLIYDFDDAIWIPNYSQENAAFQKLKSYWKVKHIIRWSYKVVAGNQFLADYAKEFNAQTEIIPTVVDTDNYHHVNDVTRSINKKPIIGWTGTLTTNLHIESLVPVFKKLNEKFDYQLLLISNKPPDIDLPNVIFQQWNKLNEINQLMQFDVGLMPLKSEYSFYQGKCGFKAIQYMALGIPTVASPIGVNKQIVDDGINGFHATSLDDWYNVLSDFMNNKIDTSDISKQAIKKIKSTYAVQATRDQFLRLFV